MILKHTATNLTPEDHLKFGILAAQAGMSKSALLRKIVEDYIKAGAKPYRNGNFRKGGRV